VRRQRRELSSVVALTLTGKIYKRHFRGSIHGEEVVVALKHFRRHIGDGFILVWDRLSAHRAKLVRDYLEEHPEILVEWLPPYAPEINPEEFCHGNVKQHLRNGTWETVSDIQPQIDRQFARLRHRRDMILHFFHHAGLTVTQLW
tara:strand:+ start:124 stop:558 length:435 start_codon:yes stop_codon:yes gene_type:complete